MPYFPYQPSKAQAMLDIATRAVSLERGFWASVEFFRKEDAEAVRRARSDMEAQVGELLRQAAALIHDEAAYQEILAEHRRPKIELC